MPHAECASVRQEFGAGTRHSASQLARNNLDLQQALQTLQPLLWQSSGNPSCCLQFQIHFQGCVLLQCSESVEGAFTVIVTWAPSKSHRGLLNCSPAHSPSTSTHWHIRPLQFLVPRQSLYLLFPKMHLEHPDYVLRGALLGFVALEHDFSHKLLKKLPWRRQSSSANARMLKIYRWFCSFWNIFL